MAEELTEQRIIEIMRDEWAKRVKGLTERTATFLGLNPDELNETVDPAIKPGLKVKHLGSGVEYEVAEVSPHEVVLLTPEKKAFCVSDKEFADEYGGPGDREPVKKKPKKEKG